MSTWIFPVFGFFLRFTRFVPQDLLFFTAMGIRDGLQAFSNTAKRMQMNKTGDRSCTDNKRRRSSSSSSLDDTYETYETSDRYRKISKKDTSQWFMQLLNSGNIDGSFAGSFLYFPQINGFFFDYFTCSLQCRPYIAYLFKKPYKIIQIIDQFSTQFCFQRSQLIFLHCLRFLVFSVYQKSLLIEFSDYWSSRHENRIDYSVNIPFRNIFPGRKKPMASIHHEIETIFTSQFHIRH